MGNALPQRQRQKVLPLLGTVDAVITDAAIQDGANGKDARALEARRLCGQQANGRTAAMAARDSVRHAVDAVPCLDYVAAVELSALWLKLSERGVFLLIGAKLDAVRVGADEVVARQAIVWARPGG